MDDALTNPVGSFGKQFLGEVGEELAENAAQGAHPVLGGLVMFWNSLDGMNMSSNLDGSNGVSFLNQEVQRNAARANFEYKQGMQESLEASLRAQHKNADVSVDADGVVTCQIQTTVRGKTFTNTLVFNPTVESPAMRRTLAQGGKLFGAARRYGVSFNQASGGYTYDSLTTTAGADFTTLLEQDGYIITDVNADGEFTARKGSEVVKFRPSGEVKAGDAKVVEKAMQSEVEARARHEAEAKAKGEAEVMAEGNLVMRNLEQLLKDGSIDYEQYEEILSNPDMAQQSFNGLLEGKAGRIRDAFSQRFPEAEGLNLTLEEQVAMMMGLEGDLTIDHKTQILLAHGIGIAEGRSIAAFDGDPNGYTFADKSQKARLLREGGLNKEQTRLLMQDLQLAGMDTMVRQTNRSLDCQHVTRMLARAAPGDIVKFVVPGAVQIQSFEVLEIGSDGSLVISAPWNGGQQIRVYIQASAEQVSLVEFDHTGNSKSSIAIQGLHIQRNNAFTQRMDRFRDVSNSKRQEISGVQNLNDLHGKLEFFRANHEFYLAVLAGQSHIPNSNTLPSDHNHEFRSLWEQFARDRRNHIGNPGYKLFLEAVVDYSGAQIAEVEAEISKREMRGETSRSDVVGDQKSRPQPSSEAPLRRTKRTGLLATMKAKMNARILAFKAGIPWQEQRMLVRAIGKQNGRVELIIDDNGELALKVYSCGGMGFSQSNFHLEDNWYLDKYAYLRDKRGPDGLPVYDAIETGWIKEFPDLDFGQYSVNERPNVGVSEDGDIQMKDHHRILAASSVGMPIIVNYQKGIGSW